MQNNMIEISINEGRSWQTIEPRDPSNIPDGCWIRFPGEGTLNKIHEALLSGPISPEAIGAKVNQPAWVIESLLTDQESYGDYKRLGREAAFARSLGQILRESNLILTF